MKNIFSIWLTLVIITGCTVAKEDPTPETGDDRAFKAAILDETMLNHTGTTWTASEQGPLSVLKEEGRTVFAFLKASSPTRAIYTKTGGGLGFVGVDLEVDKAFLYKDGTVLAWGKKEDVSFDPEHKLVSSAKGEFIEKAKGNHFLDNQSITLKDSGDVYVGETLLYTHIETLEEGKDKSIYKKNENEFIGFSVEEIEGVNSLFFYRPNKGTAYFTTKDAVEFLPQHKFSPKEDFVVLAKGTYSDVYDYTDKFVSHQELELKEDGNIYNGETVLYTFVGIKERTKALYANQDDKYIGFELVEGTSKKMFLYKNNFKDAWDDLSDISFKEDDHKITSSSFFFINLPIGKNVPLGQETYTIKENGDLFLSRNSTLAFSFHAPFGDRTDLEQDQAVYKTEPENKYVGIDVNPIEKIVTLYQKDKTTPWDGPGDIVFQDDHKVATSDSWEAVGTGLNETAIFWPSMVIDKDGNVYISFQDGTKGSVQRFDKTTATWSTIGSQIAAVSISANKIISDSEGNLIWAYHEKGGTASTGLGVQRYNIETEEWEFLGDNGTEYVTTIRGEYPSAAVDIDDNIYVLVQDKARVHSQVRKYNPNNQTWELFGQADALPNHVGSKTIVIDSLNNVIIAGNKAQINSAGTLIASKYNPTTELFEVMGENGGRVADAAKDMFMAVNGNDEIYIVYNDNNNGQRPTVKKWNNTTTTWEQIGTAGFGETSALAESTEIGFYSDDTPVVTTGGDGGNSARPAYAYQWTGAEWVKIGKDEQVSGGDVYYAGLAIDHLDDTVYVSFADLDNGRKLGVRQHRKP